MNTRLWSRITLVVAVGFGITGLAFPEIAFASENDPGPTITVYIYNYAKAAPAILIKAEREADRILSSAGLRIVWLECPVEPSAARSQGPCPKAPEATDLSLRVLAAPIQNKFQDAVFGFTVHPVLASVYYDYVFRRAKSDDAEFEAPLILGCVIAHELGHLLLGANSHSDRGIMQPRWEPNQFRQLRVGTLLFTSAQSNLMREQVQRRSKFRAESPDPGLTPGSDK